MDLDKAASLVGLPAFSRDKNVGVVTDFFRVPGANRVTCAGITFFGSPPDAPLAVVPVDTVRADSAGVQVGDLSDMETVATGTVEVRYRGLPLQSTTWSPREDLAGLLAMEPGAIVAAGLEHKALMKLKNESLMDTVKWNVSRRKVSTSDFSKAKGKVLAHAWRDTTGANDAFRLLLDKVSPVDALAMSAKMVHARAIESIVVPDPMLRPEAQWQWPLRIGVLPGSWAQSWRLRNARLMVLGEDTDICDLLVVRSARDLSRLSTVAGITANYLVCLGMDDPQPTQLARISAVARSTNAVGWIIAADSSPARSWMDDLVAGLEQDKPIDKAAWPQARLMVAHPDFAESPRPAVAPAPTPDVVSEPDQPRKRLLQVQLWEGDRRRRYALRPDRKHSIKVRIGPGDPDWLSGPVDFPEEALPFDETSDPLSIQIHVEVRHDDGYASVYKPAVVWLERTGSSTIAELTFLTPGRGSVQCTAWATYDGHFLQRVSLVVPVKKRDRGGDLRLTHADLGHWPSPDERPADAPSEVSLDFSGSGQAVLVKQGTSDERLWVDSLQVDAYTSLIKQELILAVDADLGQATPGSDQQVALLRSLASHGFGLYRYLCQQGLGDLATADTIRIHASGTNGVWPLEFAYNLGAPRYDAVLCENWLTALATGVCEHQVELNASVVCPLGFWGLRKIIERTETYTGARALEHRPRTSLSHVDSVLFAASSRADGEGPETTARIFADLGSWFGERAYRVGDWQAWRQKIDTCAPQLLLCLPHKDAYPSDNLPVLLIGEGQGAQIAQIDHEHILRTNEVNDTLVAAAGQAGSPIVMLLGCSTSGEPVAFHDFVQLFSQTKASAVVGTLVPALGRQCGPMASLAAQLLHDDCSMTSVGTLIRAVRRKLASFGYTLAMSLIAIGDASPARA